MRLSQALRSWGIRYGANAAQCSTFGSAKQDVNDDNAELDTALQKHLKHDWNEYGEETHAI